MKTKISIDKIKKSIIFCLFVVLFNFIFSIAVFLLIWYWLIPNVSVVIPPLKVWLQSLDDDVLPIAYDIVYAVSSLFAIFPGSTLALRISKKRKKDFLAHSKGRISYIEGIKYHIRQYCAYDLAIISAVVLILTIIYVAAGDVFIVRAFPIVFTMVQALGGILGVIVSMTFICLSIIVAIFFAQKKWRAEYFLNE